ncbi:hypothetical protein CK486_17790, partial [Pseudomonas sp. HAR-UPW-AIA-41]
MNPPNLLKAGDTVEITIEQVGTLQIVSADEIEDPHQLNIETKVNGEIRQQSNTKYFIFPIDEIISTLSKGMTLEPGDVIATGTPAGVGFGMNPPNLLKAGDTVEITIEQVGTLQ